MQRSVDDAIGISTLYLTYICGRTTTSHERVSMRDDSNSREPEPKKQRKASDERMKRVLDYDWTILLQRVCDSLVVVVVVTKTIAITNLICRLVP